MLAEEAARTSEKALGMFLKWDVIELIRKLFTETMDEIKDGPRGCDAGHKRHLLQSECLMLLAKNPHTTQHAYPW